MNELETVRIVRRALDARAEHLPYRVTHRLELARQGALGRMPASAPVSVPRAAPAGVPDQAVPGRHQPALFWRSAALLLPIVALVAGLLVVSVWNDLRRAEDVAEIDTAVLLDEVPIAVYADKGFGVYLRNTQR